MWGFVPYHKKGKAVMGQCVIPRILHLDSDYYMSYIDEELHGMRLIVIPEVKPDARIQRQARFLPETVDLRLDEALDVRYDRMVVYDPTRSVLEKISIITSAQSVDWIVVGNNLGAGVLKVAAVHETMRSKVIVTATSFLPAYDYEPYGVKHFTPRLEFGRTLAELLKS